MLTTGKLPAAFLGSFLDENTLAFLPVSIPELYRSQQTIERVLSTFGFERGSYVLLISLLENSVYAVPFERALMGLGLLITNADRSEYESQRIESIMRRFNVAAVVGVTHSILDSLINAGYSISTLFRGRVVWATEDAFRKLQDVPDIVLRRVLEVGPAFGLECVAGEGIHIDCTEWTYEMEAGEILISSRLARAIDFKSHPTGVNGRLDYSPCRCGNSDPRIHVVPERKSPDFREKI